MPAQILVRASASRARSLSPLVDNLALYNDFVPLVYGTAWYEPPIVFARNDGNLTRMEVLLGMGEIQGVVTVLVNDIEIPQAQNGDEHDGDGMVQRGQRRGRATGAFDPNFTDASGNPLGDPYGSMAYDERGGAELDQQRAVAAADSGADATGCMLEQFDSSGTSLGESFTNNPAWVLLDVLRRSGWLTTDIDLVSFATAAAYCGEPDRDHGSVREYRVRRRDFECNLVLQSRPSAAEVVKGIRDGIVADVELWKRAGC